MRNEPMRRNELPETCFSILPSSGQLIIIRCGERGYYPSEWDTGSREENREIASNHNVRRGITDIQEAAMLAGSMFGWNTPGANPQWYLDNARYVNSNIVQGHIKDPIMSVYYPVSSFLLRYEIMGKQHFYLPMDKLPQELMSQRSQFIMLPDLVRGLPVMPVTATFAQNESCTVQLECGCYVVGEAVNQEYHITARIRVGSAEFVMGECEKAPAPFVTWQRNCKNDGDGPPNFFWGHYRSDRSSCIEDFCERVGNEYKKQMDLLTTIKGIGVTLAAALIMATGGFTYFDNAKQLTRYLGLSPTYQQSGTSVNVKGHINRNGDSSLRSQLYVAAFASLRCNAECKACFDRLRSNGKPGKVAVIAVANKLVRQAFAIVTQGKPYVDGFKSAKP